MGVPRVEGRSVTTARIQEMTMLPREAFSTRRWAALVLAGTLTLGLAACGSGRDASTTAVGGGVGTSAETQDKAVAPGAASAVGAPGSVDTVSAGAPMVVRRADTALVVKDIRAASDAIRGLATTSGGNVLNENIQTDTGDVRTATYATMTIQVPADKLDVTLAQLDKIGEVAARTTSSDDVKAQYVDVESRIATMQTSVDRMRALLAQATEIPDIITIESELSRRQADLDALQAQLKSLKDQVAMSPISIRLTTDRTDLGSDGGGFLGGLKAGWAAFLLSVRFLLTALGAILPFAGALALVLAPIILWTRRRNRQGPAGPSGAMVPAQPYPPTSPVAASAPAPTVSAPSGPVATPPAPSPHDAQP